MELGGSGLWSRRPRVRAPSLILSLSLSLSLEVTADTGLVDLSYYSGGLRALQIQCSRPADTSTCELVEVGGYLAPKGNDFWGVEVIENAGDDPTSR